MNLTFSLVGNTDGQKIGNYQKLLITNQFLVSTIFFAIMNISFFSLRFDLFSLIAIEVHQIRNNVVCLIVRLAFLFCCALTTGRCNAFQHSFVNWKKSEFYGPYFQTVISCDYVLYVPQYGLICLNRTWICVNMSEFTIIDRVLNMHHILHSARLLYKLMSTYWR